MSLLFIFKRFSYYFQVLFILFSNAFRIILKRFPNYFRMLLYYFRMQGKVSSISRIHFDVKNKENKDTRRNVNELTTIKKIVMICEKFEPKNDVKTRMKNMRARAALVREPPKPHRPVLTLRTLERGKNTFFPRLAHRSHRSTCTRIFPSDSSQNNIKICENVSS